MLFPLMGLLVGLLIGIVIPFEIPLAYSSYLSIAILAALNSIFGGIQGDLEGCYNQKLFITGFFGNTVLAALLTYIGDRVGVPIYYAAIFYFGTSLFSNFAKIRRYYFHTESREDLQQKILDRECGAEKTKEIIKKADVVEHPENMSKLKDVEGDD